MAHNLATIGGRVAMAYDNETPWHQLGTRMTGITSVDDAMKSAVLDWEVRLADLFLEGGVPVPNRKAVMRDDAFLGIVSKQWEPIQNRKAFSVLDDACAEFGVTIESAGALGQGEKTWMLARLPQADFAPVPGDDVRGYFLIVNGHDGATGYGARPTPIRVVCQNTLNAALGTDARGRADGNDMISIRHTNGANAQLDAAREMIAKLIGAMKKTGETFSQLASRRMNIAEVSEYIEAVYPAEKGKISDELQARRDAVADLVWHSPGAQLAGADESGATAWAVYNAVTAFVDHCKMAQAKTEAGRTRQAASAVFGSGDDRKLAALRQARKLLVTA